MRARYINYVSRMLLILFVIQTVAPVWANDGYERVYDGHAHRQVQAQKKSKKSWKDKFLGGIKNIWHEPVVKKGAIGAGVGVGVGAAAIAEKNLLKGGLVGAGVGAGWAVLDDSKTMERRPLLKSVSKGALAGVGVSAVTGGLGAIPGAAIGAGVGAAAHYAKK